jgi:hypothetical protein
LQAGRTGSNLFRVGAFLPDECRDLASFVERRDGIVIDSSDIRALSHLFSTKRGHLIGSSKSDNVLAVSESWLDDIILPNLSIISSECELTVTLFVGQCPP